MKKIFKYSILLMFSAVALVACKDDDESIAGEWNATADYADIYFPETSEIIELDPTDDTTVSVHVSRRNTSGALTVNFDQLVNDSSIFTVGPAVFADGDSAALVTVTFPKAEIGTAYHLQLTTKDSTLVSSYSDQIIYEMTVTRIKWNLLGEALLYERGWYEWKDDEGNDLPTKCKIYQRGDFPTQYRLEDPFSIAREEGYTDGNESKYITFRIYEKADVEKKAGTDDEYTILDVKLADMMGEKDFVYFSPINTGYFHPNYKADVMMYHPAHFKDKDWTYNKVVSYQKDSVMVDNKNRLLPGKIQLAPYYYMQGIGGWDNTNVDGVVEIFFPGYKDPHVADVASTDFTWEELFEGSFTSGTPNGAPAAKFYKGTCVNKEDGCDTIFAQSYGTAYKIEAPYVDGYDLFFAVDKNGHIQIPDGYRLQKTGINDSMGHDIYAKIDQTQSSASDTEVILFITFVSDDESLEYGSYSEVLANINWIKVGTGAYTYYVWEDDENAEPDPGYELFQREDKPDTYKITEWAYGVDFMFTWDKETNTCTVPTQYIGWDYQDTEPVYISDFHYYNKELSYEKYPCIYDPESQTFVFSIVYHVAGGGTFGYGQETLQVEFDENGAPAKVRGLKSGRPLKGVFGNGRTKGQWKGTKMTKKSRLNRKKISGFVR